MFKDPTGTDNGGDGVACLDAIVELLAVAGGPPSLVRFRTLKYFSTGQFRVLFSLFVLHSPFFWSSEFSYPPLSFMSVSWRKLRTCLLCLRGLRFFYVGYGLGLLILL